MWPGPPSKSFSWFITCFKYVSGGTPRNMYVYVINILFIILLQTAQVAEETSQGSTVVELTDQQKNYFPWSLVAWRHGASSRNYN